MLLPKARFAFYNDQFLFQDDRRNVGPLFRCAGSDRQHQRNCLQIETLKLKRTSCRRTKLPKGFTDQDEYLHITFEGAKKRYGDIAPETEERLNFELFTIKTMGFAGYFLIVADFIKAGRDLGVFVGPGRGSAAGSAGRIASALRILIRSKFTTCCSSDS